MENYLEKEDAVLSRSQLFLFDTYQRGLLNSCLILIDAEGESKGVDESF